MKRQWLEICRQFANTPGDIWSGSRKIIRQGYAEFTEVNNDLGLGDAGYTNTKLTLLKKLYIHEESIATGIFLWNKRLESKKYGSVGITTFNHFMKVKDDAKKAPRASNMGPCLVSVTLTLLDSKGNVAVDVFYRTTELFKKFPADLVFLRDCILSRFNIPCLKRINFHFANITCHPMYWVTILPLVDDPIAEFESIRRSDPKFWAYAVKKTARYLCEEYFRGIAKHAQSLRVKMDADNRIQGELRTQLQDYLRTNHPGYRNTYKDPDENESTTC